MILINGLGEQKQDYDAFPALMDGRVSKLAKYLCIKNGKKPNQIINGPICLSENSCDDNSWCAPMPNKSVKCAYLWMAKIKEAAELLTEIDSYGAITPRGKQ